MKNHTHNFCILIFFTFLINFSNAQTGMTSQSVSVNRNQIWSKDLVTGELKMIGVGCSPKFSPDGKYIMYVAYEIDKKSITSSGQIGTIWIMSSNGENPKQVVPSSLGSASSPCWSPDGKYLIFSLKKKGKKDTDLYTISVQGEDLKQLTTNTSNDFSPHWTEDNYIYFVSDRGSKRGKYQIWRFKV